VFIPGSFKCNEFASAHSKRVAGAFFVSAHCKGLSVADKARVSSQSRVESPRLGPGIFVCAEKVLLPNSRGATTQDQESNRVEYLFYDSFYHEAGASIAGVAHFLQRKSGIRKDWRRGVSAASTDPAAIEQRAEFFWEKQVCCRESP
jgi:hypothetical protein